MSDLTSITRRNFVKLGMSSGIGFTIGILLPPGCARHLSDKSGLSPNAWITVHKDNTVTVVLSKSEMGQGILTAVVMLIAEEMKLDVKEVNVKFAQAHIIYGDQYTAGSDSISTLWNPLRQAGAIVRQMLINAAAKLWGIAAQDCKSENGRIINNLGKFLHYGELVEAALTMEIPTQVKLTNPNDFNIIGSAIKRLDSHAKITGQTQYCMDIVRPGMLVATIVHPPAFGARLEQFDPSDSLKIKGVVKVFAIEEGIVVVAHQYWQARKGVHALKVVWDDKSSTNVSSEGIFASYKKIIESPGTQAYQVGDFTALKESVNVVEAQYSIPFQAHATMEPMNCIAHVYDGGCDVWVPTQDPQGARDAIAQTLYSSIKKLTQKLAGKLEGRPYPEINVHPTFLGGGFGRRLNHDFVIEAIKISKQINAPVKLIWSREEDIQHDYYRPATFNRLSAKIDQDDKLVGWHHRIVGPDKNRSIGGSYPLIYAIPNIYIDYHIMDFGIPCGYWRSIGYSQNIFIIESFIDELAVRTNQDPVDYRKDLLAHAPRHLNVLNTVVKRANWGTQRRDGRFLGFAMMDFYDTIVAQVAEISVNTGEIIVHKIVCAVDCGLVVNPQIVISQIESGIIFGMTAALKSEITVKNGRTEQSNFHNFPLVTMSDMPTIEVYLIHGGEEPFGVGEVGVPCVGPAISNAFFAATGTRVRKLPFKMRLE